MNMITTAIAHIFNFFFPHTQEPVEEFRQTEVPDPEFILPETLEEYREEKKKRQEEARNKFYENRATYNAVQAEVVKLRQEAAALRAKSTDQVIAEINRREASRMEAEAAEREGVRKVYTPPDHWMGSQVRYSDRVVNGEEITYKDRIVPGFAVEMQRLEAAMIAENGEVLLEGGEYIPKEWNYGEKPKASGWILFHYRDFYVHVTWEQDMWWKETGRTEWVRTRFDGGDHLPVSRANGFGGERKYTSATRDLARMTDGELKLIQELQARVSGS